ncbi:cold-shock DNA-binding domain-containing protein [Psychromonas sp. CNPT3]|uniref:DUF1294 domain-containing protein n=1 Tax=Psychromonas sp. CNPT3 TaxID=314282 RepID=UPI00006E42A6|nr:cold shock and DUF1294 domain-containing protein [Psychromonas sp. CNPT3]AGH80893.1 cold-shock DNA-binding domain-containing protein [Psychromonas sp. CNPT3]
MRSQGKILNWNDDKGFGFVVSNAGGVSAFVHIKSFQVNARRPVNGDVITYELVQGNDQRYQAKQVKFLNDAVNTRNKTSSVGTVFTLMFYLGLFLSVLIGKLPFIILGLSVFMSLLTFIAYAFDKSAAQKGRWRTQENTLHLFSLLGGWPGAFAAQKKLHHKSSKQAFKRVYGITVVLNVGVLFWLQTATGANALHQVLMLLRKISSY